MSTPIDLDRMNDDARLAAALRSLPPQAPPTDRFPQIAAHAARRMRRRRLLRHAAPLALAACLLLAIGLWPRDTVHYAPATATPVASATNAKTQLAMLRRHSRQLQDWVGQLARDGSPLGAAALFDAAELEDRIALIDLQLGAGADTQVQVALWNRRIALLEQLGMLRSASSRLAISSPAANAQPAVWID